MFFMLRLTFWLGLTFSAMGEAPDGFMQARDGLTASAFGQAQKICIANSDKCVAAAQALQGAVSARQAPRRSDTLMASDKQPQWRGQK